MWYNGNGVYRKIMQASQPHKCCLDGEGKYSQICLANIGGLDKLDDSLKVSCQFVIL